MWAWLRELYEVRREAKMNRCESCDILKIELANARREKEMLLRHVLNPQVEEPQPAENKIPFVQKHKPWRVRQQELETADRQEHERIMKQFKDKTLTEKLEKNLGISNG